MPHMLNPSIISAPAEWERKIAVYGKLKGVDFSVDPSLVDKTRSPYCPNMINGEEGTGSNPVKRVGWRVLHDVTIQPEPDEPEPDEPEPDEPEPDEPISYVVNGLFYAEIDGENYYIAHIGEKIYKWSDLDGEPVDELYSGVNNAKSTAFFFRENNNDGLYILTGREYLVFDGETISDVADNARVPVITVSNQPSGGGEPYEAVNLITPKREEHFLGNVSATLFQLSAENIDDTPVTIKVTNDVGGETDLTENEDFTVDRTTGKVTFPNPIPPPVTGQDNIFITYSKTIDGASDKILKCTIAALYGVGGDNRVFFTGNPDFKAYDWYSGIFAPSYFPDVNYSVIGGTDTSIMGYCKVGEYLAIVKEDNDQDTTVFFRSGDVADLSFNIYDSVIFPVKPAISGIGAFAPKSFVTLGDEPMFLSRNGICGISSASIYSERTVRNRSFLLDRVMLHEEDLNTAYACEYNQFYILGINTRCYILDGRHKTTNTNGADNTIDYIYEAYHWNNIPAVCFLVHNKNMYFGTADGKICKFNYDIENMTKYSDGGIKVNQIVEQNPNEISDSPNEISDSPKKISDSPKLWKPVVCEWATPNDSDITAANFKSLVRRGCHAVCSPYVRSSAKVYYVIDGNPEIFARMRYFDFFDWNNIDFERFTFSSNESPQELYFRRKIKRYKRLMIIIRNDEINEGFGLHEIVKIYNISNYSRERT
jgi:hypothetical protein